MADWNAEVTNAILKAEKALDEALDAWRRVMKAESMLAQEKEGLERDIAHRGTARADMVVQILEMLRGK